MDGNCTKFRCIKEPPIVVCEKFVAHIEPIDQSQAASLLCFISSLSRKNAETNILQYGIPIPCAYVECTVSSGDLYDSQYLTK